MLSSTPISLLLLGPDARTLATSLHLTSYNATAWDRDYDLYGAYILYVDGLG